MYRCPRHTKSAFNLIVDIYVMVNSLSKKVYLWTNVTRMYHGLKCATHWGGMLFFKVIRWPVIGLNWMQAQIQDFSQSKKLCLLVSIASPASFWFSEHDLSHTDVENYFQCSFIVFIVFNLRIALKRPYNKQLIYLLCSVITGKSQTSALMH